MIDFWKGLENFTYLKYFHLNLLYVIFTYKLKNKYLKLLVQPILAIKVAKSCPKA